MKSGEVEIECEAPPKDVKASLPERGGSKKQYTRGGLRKAIYPPEIQKLKKARFFKPKKSLDEAIKKFESMGVPTREKRTAIRSALINDAHKKNSTLNAAKEGDTWFFWQE